MKFSFYLLASILAVLAFGTPARAAPEGGACVHRPAPAGAKAKRVAIIVGNGAYAHGIPVLPNPINDAEATAKAMAALGFEVFLSTDAASASLQQCLDQAYARLDGADVAMLYYSGHGIQIKDENYLVAVDAAMGDLARGFVPVQPVVDALQRRAKATLVLLDACRNNPMAEEGHAGLSTSTGRGLSRAKEVGAAVAPAVAKPDVVQARGLMVAYSTSPNAVARDGTGHLSPFSAAFVKTVGTSGYSIQHVMSDVTKAVGDATDWAQTPWMKSSLTSELKLGGAETLEQARSASDNHAARAQSLLDTDNNKHGAIVEALKGLPAAPSDADLKRFPKAYLSLYRAVQGGETVLPVDPGMNLVAVSTKNRAAVLRNSEDFRSTTFALWSISDQKVVARPDVGRGRATETFAFSPHGKYLAAALGGSTAIFDGTDGTKLFELRGRPSTVEFSEDESRLLLVDSTANRLSIIDVATRAPIKIVKSADLDPGYRAIKSGYLPQVNFIGNDKLCFVITSGYENGKSAIGVYDLSQGKSVNLREVEQSVRGVMCDPTGHYMVRTFPIGGGDGMEIWDLSTDKTILVKEQITSIDAIDPKGHYVGVYAAPPGFFDLATGKRGYPPTVPDGYFLQGAGVRDPSGGIVSRDIHFNPWRDWPDESLYGPRLVKQALEGLSAAEREQVDRERITYSVVAGDP